MKGLSVIGSLARAMKVRNLSMEVKRGLRNSSATTDIWIRDVDVE